MTARASRALAFLYWFFKRGKDEESSFFMDRTLGFITLEGAQEHDRSAVMAAGGEIG